MSDDTEELLKAQNQVIGILFEVVKRFQANNDLDKEYLRMVLDNIDDNERLEEIRQEIKENSEIINRLLAQLET